mgnify:CR=1 FL=1
MSPSTRRQVLGGLSVPVLGSLAGCLDGLFPSAPTTTLTDVQLWNYDETTSHRFVLFVVRDDEDVHRSEHILEAASEDGPSTTTVTCPWRAVAGKYAVDVAVPSEDRESVRFSEETSDLPDYARSDVTFRPDEGVQISLSLTELESEPDPACRTGTTTRTDDRA